MSRRKCPDHCTDCNTKKSDEHVTQATTAKTSVVLLNVTRDALRVLLACNVTRGLRLPKIVLVMLQSE